MAFDIAVAGTDFMKQVLTLYRSAKYFREKEILAKKFIDYSLEASRLVSAVAQSEYGADPKQALYELDRALFTLKVMCAEKIYPRRRSLPVETLGYEIKRWLLPLAEAQAASAQQEVIAAPAPAEPVKEDENEQLSLLTVTSVVGAAEEKEEPAPAAEAEPEQDKKPEAGESIHPDKLDVGGFNEVYTGKL